MQRSFESALGELERIVGKLEDGDLPLEESLKLFEDGVKLSRECRERLTQAERRIEVLMKDADGSPVLQELQPEKLRAERAQQPAKRIVFGEPNSDDEPF